MEHQPNTSTLSIPGNANNIVEMLGLGAMPSCQPITGNEASIRTPCTFSTDGASGNVLTALETLQRLPERSHQSGVTSVTSVIPPPLCSSALPQGSTKSTRNIEKGSESSRETSMPKGEDKDKKKSLGEVVAKPPKQRRGTVPCKARRMPSDHDHETAVFVLHKDMKHGEHLVCSYSQCRGEGVKFCYCSLCGIPVAKRNFKSRHDHSRRDTKGNAQEQAPPKEQAPSNTEKKKRKRDKPVALQATQDPITRPVPTNVVELMASTPAGKKTSGSRSKRRKTKETYITADDRMWYWYELLAMRAALANGEGLGLWMDMVVLVSNREVPVREVTASFRKLSAVAQKMISKKKSDTSRNGNQSLSVSGCSSIFSASMEA